MDLRAGSKVKSSDDRELEIVDVLGSGGFGTVFKARDDGGAFFAVKTVSTASLDSTEVKALKNEAERAQEIRHPNVLTVHFFHDGVTFSDLPPYIVSDYADSGTLEAVVNRRSEFFPNEDLRALFSELIDGMEAVNSKLVHRDIKPDNVLIHGGMLKIADFGLSKIVGAATRSSGATFKGFGTLEYCAPEAFVLEDNTPAMDMYSMGVVFYRLATLRFPYDVSPALHPAVAWRDAHTSQTAADPRSINASLPFAVAQTILKMIAKRASDRFQTWDEVRRSLSATDGKSSASPSVTALVERVMARHLAEQAQRAEEEHRREEARQTLNRLAFAFGELERDVREIVADFNAQSEFGKLAITREPADDADATDSFALTISTDAGRQQGWDAEKLILSVVSSLDRWTLPYDKRSVLAAGAFATSKTKHGINVMLLSDDPADLYGKWHVLRSRPNPLVGEAPSFPDPRAFMAGEFDEQIRYVGVSLHTYHMKLTRWEKSVVTEILGFLL